MATITDLLDSGAIIKIDVELAPRDQPLVFSHPVLEYHQALISGAEPELEERFATYVVRRSRAYYSSFPAWLEHLTWCHGKDKRGYLYEVDRMSAPVPLPA